MARTNDGVFYDTGDLEGECEVIYDAVDSMTDNERPNCIRTWIFADDGELLEETILVW